MPEFAKKNMNDTKQNMNNINNNDIDSQLDAIEKETLSSPNKTENSTTPPETKMIEKEPVIPATKKEYVPYSELRKKKKNSSSSTEEPFTTTGIFRNRRNVFFMFITPPIIISIISALHLISFYEAGNPLNMAYFLAGSIEIASIASLLALMFLQKIRKGTVLFLFAVIIAIQLIGNMFFSFMYLQTSPLLQQLLDFFSMQKSMGSLRWLSFIIGGVPVLISLGFIKASLNYME